MSFDYIIPDKDIWLQIHQKKGVITPHQNPSSCYNVDKGHPNLFYPEVFRPWIKKHCLSNQKGKLSRKTGIQNQLLEATKQPTEKSKTTCRLSTVDTP